MKDFILSKKKLLDYLPFILIPLIFIADEEMEKHALRTTFQLGIVVLTLIIFFIIFFRFKSRSLAFIVAVLLWGFLQFQKNKF